MSSVTLFFFIETLSLLFYYFFFFHFVETAAWWGASGRGLSVNDLSDLLDQSPHGRQEVGMQAFDTIFIWSCSSMDLQTWSD